MRLFDWPFGALEAQSFDLIMADPPWQMQEWSEKGDKSKSTSSKYNLMSLDAIKALPVLDLAAPDCVLWLWATNPMLPQAFDVLASWGFTFKTAGSWGKTTPSGKLAFGTGYILRSANEPFLIGTRGAPKTSRSVRSLIMAPRREHSRKPDEAFSAAEHLIPGARRLELFSRTDRPGWSTWGDEVGKFGMAAASEAAA
ncbi:MT-A70 family methyltransferase [Aurantimonas coralicida]|uniref:MT-A70 family methyltransferase n=1 Tax=Aurantimonas coralicida TaxID=182270 RepID=UPI001D1867FD|nr:MT-A70 family methyltransferase [Aurantimonas coralicida]MCC4299333.1 DNA methyltransferase [Aurantimonas coralicida]